MYIYFIYIDKNTDHLSLSMYIDNDIEHLRFYVSLFMFCTYILIQQNMERTIDILSYPIRSYPVL